MAYKGPNVVDSKSLIAIDLRNQAMQATTSCPIFIFLSPYGKMPIWL